MKAKRYIPKPLSIPVPVTPTLSLNSSTTGSSTDNFEELRQAIAPFLKNLDQKPTRQVLSIASNIQNRFGAKTPPTICNGCKTGAAKSKRNSPDVQPPGDQHSDLKGASRIAPNSAMAAYQNTSFPMMQSHKYGRSSAWLSEWQGKPRSKPEAGKKGKVCSIHVSGQSKRTKSKFAYRNQAGYYVPIRKTSEHIQRITPRAVKIASITPVNDHPLSP